MYLEAAANAEYAPETCAWCNGSGVDRDQTDGSQVYDCDSCDGQGRIQVARPSVPCVRCNGAGGAPGATQRDECCQACYGSGWSLRWVQPVRR